MNTIMPSIFGSQSPDDTWSITTHFGALLRHAESLYAPRVMDCTPLGIQVGETNQPALMPFGGNMWYISLRKGVDTNLPEAIFDVSHEVIHLLGPVAQANSLEEGLATAFSMKHGCDSVPQLAKSRQELGRERYPSGIGRRLLICRRLNA
jgi:hypothetical protein